MTRGADGWSVDVIGSVKFAKPRQIATFADACNECGNCGVLCPEDGGPYLAKPLFFGSLAAFEAARDHDGFVVEKSDGGFAMRGRFGGEVVTVEKTDARVRYSGAGFDLAFDPADVAATVSGAADGPVDFTRLRMMLPILEAIVAPDAINYVSAGLARRDRVRRREAFPAPSSSGVKSCQVLSNFVKFCQALSRLSLTRL